MATIQVRIDDEVKTEADNLFSSLGLDTSTAVRMFIFHAIERDGMPFPIGHRTPTAELLEAMEDVRLGRNIYGPYATVDEAMKAMLED
jgi:DNA-damage-inducible protein J